jgi:hypothetical protein
VQVPFDQRALYGSSHQTVRLCLHSHRLDVPQRTHPHLCDLVEGVPGGSGYGMVPPGGFGYGMVPGYSGYVRSVSEFVRMGLGLEHFLAGKWC